METFLSFLGMSVWGYVHLSAVALRGQKRAVDPVELESQVVLSSLMGMLGTKLRSSAKAQSSPEPPLWPLYVLCMHLLIRKFTC